MKPGRTSVKPVKLMNSLSLHLRSRQFPFLCALLIGTGALPATASASGPAQFQNFISHTHSARVHFTQTVTALSGRKPQLSSGQLSFSRPGRFRWTYETPYYQLLVGDGTRLWIHDRDLNQVTVKTLGDALGASPAALLAGDNALDKNFIITDAGSSDGLEFIEAMPRNKDEGSFELVRIGLRDNLPQVMIVHDNFGQRTRLNFSQFERNPKLPDTLFQFTPPEGADVLGE